jgi:hypothetical protein
MLHLFSDHRRKKLTEAQFPLAWDDIFTQQCHALLYANANTYPSNMTWLSLLEQSITEDMLPIDGTPCKAFRADNLDYIIIGWKGVRIDEACTYEEDEYFPGTQCNSHEQG